MRRKPSVCGIYLITVRRPNGLPLYYVGQSIQCARRRTYHFKTLKAGRHDNAKLQNAYNKYGVEALSFDVLEECSHDRIDALEQWWLDEMHGYARTLNLAKDATSPNRGRTFSEDTRRKVSEAGRGRVQSEETRRKRSETMKGWRFPEDSKHKISETKKARAHLYTKQVGSLHHASKPVIGTNLSTGEVVRLEAQRSWKSKGFDSSAIGKVCCGIWPAYKGWVWRWEEEPENKNPA